MGKNLENYEFKYTYIVVNVPITGEYFDTEFRQKCYRIIMGCKIL